VRSQLWELNVLPATIDFDIITYIEHQVRWYRCSLCQTDKRGTSQAYRRLQWEIIDIDQPLI